jgi:MarR family transcriptional regulator, organic hydroperoxide resistance regulator
MSTQVVPRPSKSRKPERPAAPLTASRPELLPGGSDAEFRALVHGLLAFSSRLESVRAGLARCIGLTPIQYTILISVAHLETAGDVGVNQLAMHLQLSGAFITIETGKLLKQNLLTKQPDPADRRRVCLHTTPKARHLLASLAPTQVGVNDLLFEFLDAASFRRLRAMVDSMNSCANRALSRLNYVCESERPA